MNVCTMRTSVCWLCSVEAPKDPQDKMEPAYTPLLLQSASFSRIPFLSSLLSRFFSYQSSSSSSFSCFSLVSTLCFFSEIRLRGQIFPHADAKSTKLLEIIAMVNTRSYRNQVVFQMEQCSFGISSSFCNFELRN